MRPNTITVRTGLGLRQENDSWNIEPILHLGPVHTTGPSPRIPFPKPAPVQPPRRIINPKPRIPRPVHLKPTPKPKPLPKITVCPQIVCEHTIGHGPAPCHTPICGPSTICGPGTHLVKNQCVPIPTPPPKTPSGDYCPHGVVDAAGNCVAAQPSCPLGTTPDGYGNCVPYASTPAAMNSTAAAAAAAGCPTGYIVDPNTGNCIAAPTDWFTESTIIPGVENLWIAGAGAIAAYFFFFRGGKKR